MDIKILFEYIDYCTEKGIEPTFDGLYEWKDKEDN